MRSSLGQGLASNWEILDFVSLLYFCAAVVYFRFFLSQRTTRHSSARATRLRTPQLYWLLAFQGAGALWILSLRPALVFCIPPFYYGLRFGSLSALFGLIVGLVLVVEGWQGRLGISSLASILFAGATTFFTDLGWNWYLKRKGNFI